MRSKSLIASLGLVVSTIASPHLRNQKRASHSDLERAEAVKRVFETSWKGYYDYAFPHDNLHPIDNTFDDDRYGWGVTAVDSMDTAILMGEVEIVDKMLDHVAKIDFTTTAQKGQVLSVFESNIRYLGGLLASYDLLQGPYRWVAPDSRKVDVLLEQAKSLANSLSVAFTTPSGVPDPDIVLNPVHKRSGSTTTNIADIGTLVLEWTRLSDLTGNKTYSKLAKTGEEYLLSPHFSTPKAGEPWPGLIGTEVYLENGTFQDNEGGWSGLDDSFYEYLIKMYLYDPDEFSEYKDRWVLAADSTMAHLASHPTSRQDLTFLAAFNGQNIIPSSSNLASFAAGNFILGGIVLNEPKYVEFGKKLADSYIQTYTQDVTGIGPEAFSWVASEIPSGSPYNPPPPSDQKDFYAKSGFYVTSPGYYTRPETIESLWYAYRATGDRKYQDLAWDAFQAITSACRVGSGYSAINDVTVAGGGGFDNLMESFWIAEVLKYFYLLFASDAAVQFQSDLPNGYVFNTEAHPMKIRQK